MVSDAIERRLHVLQRDKYYKRLLEDRAFLRQLDFTPQQQAVYEARVRRINERYEHRVRTP
jgi:hypothetical protein